MPHTPSEDSIPAFGTAGFDRDAAGRLCVDSLPLATLAADYGTPLYVYSEARMVENYRAWADPLAQLASGLGIEPGRCGIAYAVKANGNLALLQRLAALGSGFDIVSGGELARVLKAGGRADRVVFSGVGKRSEEIEQALAAGIHCFNVESTAELERIDRIAQTHGAQAPVSLRINPDVDARTHPYIATGLKDNKFGIPMEQALGLYQHAAGLAGVRLVGLDCHIGSQLLEIAPFLEALNRLLALWQQLGDAGIPLEHLDLGGGLGIGYGRSETPAPSALLGPIQARLAAHGFSGGLWFEPGRSIVGNAGVLLTRVEYLKPTPHRRFAIVDAGMNDLMRPSLYQAHHEIEPVEPAAAGIDALGWDVVGPVCESADVLGRDRLLAIREGEVLAIRDAGAYAMSMSGQYNARPRPAEVLVRAASTSAPAQVQRIRDRDTVEMLWAQEHLL